MGASQTASPTSTPSTTDTASAQIQNAESIAHMVALGAVIATPVLLLMPPRKLDLYTVTLIGCGAYSGNYLIRERYGAGVLGLAGRRLGLTPSSTAATDHGRPGHESTLERFSLPTERARELHEMMAADRAAAERRRESYRALKNRADGLAQSGWGVGGDMRRALATAQAAADADARRHGWPAPALGRDEEKSGKGHMRSQVLTSAAGTVEDGEQSSGVAGLARKVWMGGEPSDWKEKRLREEQEALDQGKGYSDMILDQIWEVWNWDKKKNEDGEWVPKDDSKLR